MKITRLITSLTVMLLFSNVLTATNPPIEKAGNKANIMVEDLSKYIVLTEYQKAKIETWSKDYMVKIKNANKLVNREELVASKKAIIQEYKMSLDSILTNEQKTQRLVKQNERIEAVISKYRTKK